MESNIHEMHVQTGDAPKLKSVYAIALYDPNSGKIHHIHHVLTMEGSSPMEPQEVEKNVIATAKKLGHDVEKLKVLHTQDLQDLSGNYRVDVEKKTLVKLPQRTIPEKVEK
jgi:hypothetical protein